MNKMKVAMVAAGQPRFFKRCIDSMINNIKGADQVDLYFYLWEDNKMDFPYVQMPEPEFFNPDNTIKLEAIEKLLPNNFKIKKFVVVESPTFEQIVPSEVANKPRNIPSTRTNLWLGNLYKQYYSLNCCYKLIEEQYDCLIRYRTDCILYYPVYLNLLNLSDSIYTPSTGEVSLLPRYPKISDQFAIGNQTNMGIYFSLFDKLNLYYLNGIDNAETLLSAHLCNNGVKVNNTSGIINFIIGRENIFTPEELSHEPTMELYREIRRLFP